MSQSLVSHYTIPPHLKPLVFVFLHKPDASGAAMNSCSETIIVLHTDNPDLRKIGHTEQSQCFCPLIVNFFKFSLHVCLLRE